MYEKSGLDVVSSWWTTFNKKLLEKIKTPSTVRYNLVRLLIINNALRREGFSLVAGGVNFIMFFNQKIIMEAMKALV